MAEHLDASSWDTHVHVFDPEHHPYIQDALYRPPKRSVADLVAAIPTTNFVIVMSGPEGTDSALTLEAIKELRRMGRQAKGVVVMDLEQMTTGELRRLNDAGVRSVRFNTRRDGTTLDKLFEETVKLIHNTGVKWSIEAAIFSVGVWHGLAPTLRSLHEQYGTVFVADHVFAAQPDELKSAEFKELLELIDQGVIVVKISGLTRYGRDPRSMLPMVKEILRQRDGGGVIWGSDWPYVISKPGATGFMDVDIGDHLALLKEACDEVGEQRWGKLMGHNAAELYD